MASKYLVVNLQDVIYQVVNSDLMCGEEKKVYHQGSLSDCDSWIRLEDGGYL